MQNASRVEGLKRVMRMAIALRGMKAVRALSGMAMATPWEGSIGSSRFSQTFLKPRLGEFLKPQYLTVVSKMSAMAEPEPTTEKRSRRVFADHVFYKGKCALNMRITRPVFKISDAGDAILSREGTVMLEFAPCVAQRQYDWGKKQLFALSVGELGQILSLSSSESLEFFHDPNMGKTDAGMVRKSFKIEPTADRTGYFFNLTVTNKLEKAEARLNIPISKGEFAVVRSAANYALPYLMGWHYVADASRVDEAVLTSSGSGAAYSSVAGAPKSMVPPLDLDPEWDK